MTMRWGITAGLVLGLVGCERIPGSIATDPSKDAASRSAWTTLGSRNALSEPVTPAAEIPEAKWVDYNPPDLYPATATQSFQTIVMPDGTQIAVYVTLPADESGHAISGKFPTVLSLTGYNTDTGTGGSNAYFVRHGYGMVVADVRGTGRSSGDWDAFGAMGQSDFPHIIDWIVQQDWSDGKIANWGESYVGITALQAGAQQHPAIKAIFAEIAAGDLYRDLAFAGGQFSTIFAPSWLALVAAGSFQHPDKFNDFEYDLGLLLRLSSLPGSFQVQFLVGGLSGDPEIAYDGPFSAERSPVEAAEQIRAPTFLIGGLYDIFQRGEPLNYEKIKAGAGAKLLLGPWNHTALGSGLPADGVPVLNHIALQWFDHYVKGLPIGADKIPNVTQYVAGYGHYVTSTDWPHPEAHAQTLYLRGDKAVSVEPPAADEASNYTLQHPVGGLCDSNTNQWSAGVSGNLPFPCQYNNNLAYVTELVYETAPLTEDLYINGPMQADLWVSTTALDTGLSIRVDDMDGSTGTQISSGLQTASLRAVDESRSRFLDGLMIQPWHPFTQDSVQAVPYASPVQVPVEIFPVSALVLKGHRLRFSIGASDLTRGIMPLPALAGASAGILTVFSDAEHLSRIVIPAVPAALLEPADSTS